MVEFTIQLEEQLVKAYGHSEVERFLQEIAHQALLKMAAKGVLADLSSIDLENDEDWKRARELAWEKESGNYMG